MTRVRVSYPNNIKREDRILFTNRRFFYQPKQSWKFFNDVLVTPNGLCVSEGMLIPECHHDYPEQINYYRSDAAYYYFQAMERPQSIVNFDDGDKYFVVHHPWFNYYHWICESIFRIWLLKDDLKDFVLVLPGSYRGIDFICRSLEPFSFRNIVYLDNDAPAFFRTVCIPQLKPKCDSYNVQHVREIRNFYVQFASLTTSISNWVGERIYISRKYASRRDVVNEEEVTNALTSFGFSIFYPEKYSFLEQVKIFNQAKMIIGIHGSALTNILFMPQGSFVLELIKPTTNELNYPSPLFWYLSTPLELNYSVQICQDPEFVDYFEGDYYVDVKRLQDNVMMMSRDFNFQR